MSISRLRNPDNHLSVIVFVLIVVLMLGMTFVCQYPEISHFNRLVGALLVGSVLMFRFPKGFRMPPEVICFGFFLLYSIPIGLLLAESGILSDPAESLAKHYARQLIQTGLLVSAITCFCWLKKSTTGLFVIIVACATILAAYGEILGDHAAAREADSGYVRATGASGKNANTYATSLICGICAAAYLWGTRKVAFLRPFLALSVLLMGAAMIVTGSRRGLLVLPVFVVLWLWFCYWRDSSRRCLAVSLTVISLIVGYFLYDYVKVHTLVGRRLETTAETEADEGTRSDLYRRGFELFLEYPIVGVGLGNFLSASKLGLYAHSEFMEILASTGLIGCALYFPIYYIPWRRLTRLHRVVSDSETRYQIGVSRAIIITMMTSGLAEGNVMSISFWFLLSGVIGFSCSLEESTLKTGYSSVKSTRRTREPDEV